MRARVRVCACDQTKQSAVRSLSHVHLGGWAQIKYNCLYPALFGTAKTVGVIRCACSTHAHTQAHFHRTTNTHAHICACAHTLSSKIVFDVIVNGPLVYFPLLFLDKGVCVSGMVGSSVGGARYGYWWLCVEVVSGQRCMNVGEVR